LLTQEFKSYCQQMSFEPIFCRKSDPESKGKIENVVKFVKNNLLSGRIYMGDEQLNKTAQGWLSRTANGKEHAGIKKVPQQEWLIERNYLQPIKPSPVSVEINLPQYKVRKDNTINYKSNFYTLPLGTYQNQDTWVLLKEKDDQVRIYDQNNYLLTIHTLSYQRGQTIRNVDHKRDKSQSAGQLKETVLQMMPEKAKGLILIEQMAKDKPRYLRDNLLVLKKHLPEFEPDIIKQAVNFCLEHNVYNGNRFVEITKYYKVENTRKAKSTIPEVQIKKENVFMDIKPGYSQIDIYETIL